MWGFQWSGYMPCELCLLERYPFYGAVPLAVATAGASRAGGTRLTLAGFAVLAALFLASAGLAAYHAGVEWQFWTGPSGCTGSLTAPAGINDFLHQLDTVKVMRCDAAALRLLGVSLAGWNVVVSLILSVVACTGLGAAQRASEVFEVHSQPGIGTALLSQIWPKNLTPSAEQKEQHGADDDPVN